MSVQVPREELPESVLEPELRPLQSDDRRLSARHPQPVQLAACVPVPTRLSSTAGPDLAFGCRGSSTTPRGPPPAEGVQVSLGPDAALMGLIQPDDVFVVMGRLYKAEEEGMLVTELGWEG